MADSHRPPNILLIFADQWRADALSCAGHPVAQTPHLDALASTGTRFRQAYTACPSCIAARAGLLTGLKPATHGFVGYRDGVNWRYAHTLPRSLGAVGYQTHCVGKMHTHPIRNRVGFDEVALHDGYLHYGRRTAGDAGCYDDYLPWLRERLGSAYADYTDTGLGCNGYSVAPWTRPEELHPMSWVTSRSLDFLRRRDPTQPFFLMASYHRPHPPLDPPVAYWDRFRDVPLDPPAMGDWVDWELGACRGLDGPVPNDPVQRDIGRRAYFAQLAFLDAQVNRLIMGLSEAELPNETWIVFSADHGDLLYDHNLVAKAQPFAGSAGIPLIIRPPAARWSNPRGNVSDAVVELRDLYPTFLDLAGAPVPDHLEGASLLPVLAGEAEGVREWLHGEHTDGVRSNHWLTDGHEKYCWYSQTGRELLFDLDADPTECHNLATARPDQTALWRSRLITELADRPEGFTQADELVAGRPVTSSLEWVGVGRGG